MAAGAGRVTGARDRYYDALEAGRNEVAYVWELVVGLMERAEETEDAALAAPLREAYLAMDRLLRAPGREERCCPAPVTPEEVEELACAVDMLDILPGVDHLADVESLLAAVGERVRQVAAVLAERASERGRVG